MLLLRAQFIQAYLQLNARFKLFGLGEIFCCHLGGGGTRKNLDILRGEGVTEKNGNSVSNFHPPPPS